MNTFKFRQLDSQSYLENEQLRDIAGLIYDTDPYIYPAMFNSRSESTRIIPEMIQMGDSMFKVDNMLVAEENQHVVGLVLWNMGPLYSDRRIYDHCLKKLGIDTSPYIDAVQNEYFLSYKDVPSDTISIINVCVDEYHRNKGIGRALLEHLIKSTEDKCENYELFVLKENPAAVRLYLSLGFCIQKEIHGFSIDKNRPPCYIMTRPALIK